MFLFYPFAELPKIVFHNFTQICPWCHGRWDCPLVAEVSSILESEKTDAEKLSEITSMMDVARESTCYVCLLDSKEEHPSKTKGLCQKHYGEWYQRNRIASKKYHKEPYPVALFKHTSYLFYKHCDFI
ncbi:hypothetical protein SAM19_03386 [Brevibacillus laterosporus]|nr:hypothetical protein [Brevibacillus laterosporus]